MDNRETGNKGEEKAAVFLEGEGYRILERNVRRQTGEIDIIARDPQGEVVFVEVKTRNNRQFGLPEEAVNRQKMEKITKTALLWVQSYSKNDIMWRIDIISVEPNSPSPITHLKNVTQEQG